MALLRGIFQQGEVGHGRRRTPAMVDTGPAGLRCDGVSARSQRALQCADIQLFTRMLYV